MRQYLASKIRNVALAGHGGSGKTSLAEAMLYTANATSRLGRVAEGNTVCDFDPEEIKRKVSVSSAVAPFEWKDTKINLIDTPGLFDFEAGLYEGIRAAESVVITVSGKSGCAVGTEKAYKLAKQQKKSIVFFVSKLDTDTADFDKAVASLKDNFGNSVCPIIVPYTENNEVKCYVNLIDMKAYTYDEKGQATEVDMPDFDVSEYVDALNEAIAETDENLMDKFFSGEKFTREEFLQGLTNGVAAGSLLPVVCGSTITMAGVTLLSDVIVNILPSPAQNGKETGKDAADKPVEIHCDENAPLAAYIFKTVADPFVGKLSYVKVVAGKLSGGTAPINARTGQSEKLGKILFTQGKKQDDADYIGAGDIGCITKLAETVTGDTLCDSARVVSLTPTKFPAACLHMAVKPKNKGDESKIAQGIQRLMEEDPTVTFETNKETHQQVLGGLGEQHLDIIVSRLKSKFGVDVELEQPRVAYRETIRKKVKVQGRHKKQSGGHGQFGDVWIEFEPCDSDSMEFAEKVFGGAVPKNFFPAVEKGLQECIKRGPLAGYPVVGLKATLVDGSYHPVDSSEMAFKMAAALAYKAGMPTASPVILEPIGSLKVYCTDANTGDVMGELNKRRGRVLGMNPLDDGMQEIVAEVPMSEMHDFATLMRSVTQGRGYFTLAFERYEQLPNMLESKVIEEAKQLNSED